jgi:hypothetical protein
MPVRYAYRSLYTTVEDLLLWDRNFLNNQLGGPEFLDVMHTKGF